MYAPAESVTTLVARERQQRLNREKRFKRRKVAKPSSWPYSYLLAQHIAYLSIGLGKTRRAPVRTFGPSFTVVLMLAVVALSVFGSRAYR